MFDNKKGDAVKSSVKGRSSERIAEGILKKLGYVILEKNKKITLDEADAFEVDFIAKDPNGVEYTVEVKGGKASVSDIRQTYADSKILDSQPLIVCKGLADEAAKAVVRELGVKVLTFSEHYIILEPEELETIVRSAVGNVLGEYGFYPLPPWDTIRKADLRIIKGVAKSSSIDEASKTLNIKAESLVKRLGEMRVKKILPRRSQDYSTMRKFCQQIIYRYDLIDRLDRIEKKLKRISNKKHT